MSLRLASHFSSRSDQSLRTSSQHWYVTQASTQRNTWWSHIGIEPSALHAAGTHAHQRQCERSAQSWASAPATARVRHLACAWQPCAALHCRVPCPFINNGRRKRVLLPIDACVVVDAPTTDDARVTSTLTSAGRHSLSRGRGSHSPAQRTARECRAWCESCTRPREPPTQLLRES